MDETRTPTEENPPASAPTPTVGAPVPDPTGPAAEPSGPIPSPWTAAAGVVASPTPAFAAMRGAKWHFALWPMALLGILGGLASFTFLSRVDMESFVRDQLQRSRFASQMSAEQMDKALESAKDVNPYTRALWSLPASAILLLLASLVYWVGFLALGRALSYSQTLIVVSWAQVPKAIQAVLACIILAVKDPSSVDPMNPVLSNAGAILGQDALAGWQYALLSSLDLFALWTAVLCILGFAAAGKMRRSQAATVVIAVFAAKVLLWTAWAFFFQT